MVLSHARLPFRHAPWKTVHFYHQTVGGEIKIEEDLGGKEPLSTGEEEEIVWSAGGGGCGQDGHTPAREID